MPKTKAASPARSQGGIPTPKRKSTRGSRSLCSPALSTASGRLTSLIDQFKDKNMESFALSPLNGRSVLNDNTEIEEPRRKSWWKKLDENSQDVMEVLEDNKLIINNAIEEFVDIEVLSQEKKNYTLDLPESSDNESINSIVLPQRRLFTQKENQTQKKFGHLIDNRESLAKLPKTNTTNFDKSVNVGTRELFRNAKRSKPIFPAALLNISPNKTAADKTKENVVADPKPQVRNIFGNRPANKRKNMFADFIVSESEDEISEIQPKVFGFQKKFEQRRFSSASKGRDPSPSSSITTDIEMDFRNMLPSSTMVENQLEDMMESTPVKRTRLSKLSEAKESEAGTNTLQTNSTVGDKTRQSNKSASSKNKSKASPETKDKSLNSSRTTRSMLKNTPKHEENKFDVVNFSVKQDAKGNKSQNKFKGIDLDVSPSKSDTDKESNTSNKSKKQNKSRITNSSRAIETEIESEEIGKVAKAINNVTRVINKSANKSLPNTTATNKSVNEKERTVTLKVHDKLDKTGSYDIASNGEEDDENNFTLEYENDDNEVIDEGLAQGDPNQSKKDNTIKQKTVILEKATQNSEINKSKSNKSSLTNKSLQKIQKPVKTVEESVESQTEQYSADDNVDGVQDQVNQEIDKDVNNSREDNNKKIVQDNEDKVNKSKENDEEANESEENEDEVNVSQENEDKQNESEDVAMESQEVDNGKNEAEEDEEDDNESDNNEDEASESHEVEAEVNESQEIEDDANESQEVAAEENKHEETKDDANESQEVAAEENESQENAETANKSEEVNAEANESQEIEREADESQEVEEQANESQENAETANKSEEVNAEANESQDIEEEANESQDIEEEANESQDIEEDAKESQDIEEEANESQDIEEEANESQDIEEDANESQDVDEEANESQDIEEDANGSQDIEEDANESQEVEDDDAQDGNAEVMREDEEETANESQVNEASTNDSQEVANDEEEMNELTSEAEVNESDEDQQMDDSDEADKAIASDPEISDDNQADEMEVDDDEDEEQESENESDQNEHESHEERQIEEQNEIEASEEIEESPNVTHDTTGRHRKKHLNKSPEVARHDKTNQMDSFTAKGRNTSVRKTKSMISKSLNIRPSLAPHRDSTGFSDGTRNSSAEGSGWDSHRTTRKTLRQTFGKDFTPRKSLRALVMEKSAKRQTEHMEMHSETVKFPLANSTEMPEDSNLHVENVVESDHEMSSQTRLTALEIALQKIKEQNIEKRLKLEAAVRNSLKNPPTNSLSLFKVPNKPAPRRLKPAQIKPKKQMKSLIPLDELPAEVIQDMKYKPPKRFRPSNASWITKRLYKFLEEKLEAKYDYKARVRAEKLAETLYNFTKDLRRHNVAPTDAVEVLKHEFARLEIVRTHFEFYEFFHEFMPREVRIKVVPDIVNKISLPRHGVFSDILRE